MADLIIKCIVQRPNGCLEAEPDFPAGIVFFYPVPKSLVKSIKEGDIWEGSLGRLWDTGKIDKEDRKICIRYFIPKRRIQ